MSSRKNPDSEASEAPSLKKKKLPTLIQSIELLLDEATTSKLSLAALKSQLSQIRGLDYSKGAQCTQLKKALAKGEQDGIIIKIGGSYAKPGYEPPPPPPPEASALNPQWRGLRIIQTENAKSSKSKCQQCMRFITEGSGRYCVLDDSLFKACVFPGDSHEGVDRGYVEGVGPHGENVGRRKFFIHIDCYDDANKSCEAAFWANLPMLDLAR